VGELAIYFALAMGLRVFYTTPLKALSNQKLHDFRRLYGKDRVGLLTGDIQHNRDAPVTILTTEVFRNMLYEPSNDMITNLFAVIFDEFHYMNDPDRGTVWEESVISCPKHIRIVALSATMGNVEDIQVNSALSAVYVIAYNRIDHIGLDFSRSWPHRSYTLVLPTSSPSILLRNVTWSDAPI
jgi:superfamily II RNA helicase